MSGGALDKTERIAWLRLTRTEGIGAITFHRLIEKYESATRALDALPRFARARPVVIPSVTQIEDEIATCEKINARMIAACEPEYPVMLAAIEDAPPVITVRGNLALLQKQSVALVGSRNCSLNGRRFTHKLGQDLGQAGYAIVSGLARGIDTAAHEGSLKTGTIAVVAGGVDVVYPKENQSLYDQICATGIVVSECSPGTQPLAQHFPKRNRIVTGLSVAVVVVEASLKSGSLISARMAAEQGRDVMAVPGFPSDPRAEGTNALLRDGATLIRSAEDVIEQIGSFTSRLRTPVSPPETGLFEEAHDIDLDDETARDTILSQLSASPVGVDEIVRACQLKSAVVQGTLLELELSGLVQRLPGNRVCLM